TYPLPEAQLDRFVMKIAVGYPKKDDEVQILRNVQDGFDPKELQNAGIVPLPPEALDRARKEVSAIRVEPNLLQYIVALAARTRNWPAVSLGASPRAAISLMQVAKGVAAIEGRDFLIPDDVKQAAPAVLRHRLVLKPEADLEGITADQVVRE